MELCDSQGYSSDELAQPGSLGSLGSSPSHRRSKRRKLTRKSHDEFDSSSEKIPPSSSRALNSDGPQPQDQKLDDTDQNKPKSKYKIHIPKNSELPKDAFFTQPPQRSSSPYRIDQFYWKKPRSEILDAHISSRSVNQQKSQSLPVNEELIATDGENVARLSDQAARIRSQVDDEFSLDESYAEMLADLPSDAFSSLDSSVRNRNSEPILISSQQALPLQDSEPQRPIAQSTNLRQATLFGSQAAEVSSRTQTTQKHNWPLANRAEPPTHHELDREALETWVYPTNLGSIRDYQYSIVARGLYHNMLVALPTGLGKTFIAATIMLNWFRWTKESQIVFVAPTKPLVSQQVKACFAIAGIPRSATTMLTGGISPGLRAEEWQSKRVFFMTPQTIVNDLKTGICDPKKLVLLVVDEAHRATGGYAYVEVVKFLRRFNTSFRVLALTATPGSSVESVQEVIDGLGISRVEIRTEESLDIRQYVHPRKIETMLFENSDEMIMVMELFSKALQPVLDKLCGMNAYWARDPMTLTPYGCNQARQRWMASDAGRKGDFGIKGMVNTIFSLLASLSHGSELLKFHGIGPFYHKVLAFRNEIHANGKKGGKYAKQINESEPFQTMMSRVQLWINNPDFIGHPKLEYLQRVVVNHFLDASERGENSNQVSTKVMVFAHYRDSAEEITGVLRRNDPLVRPHVFVGQATSKGSEGMDQKKQLDIIRKFQSGTYNTLVATSIGEEGLDIGEVDLIVCYDASASPIRMLQRMGRTGRKRAGNIIVTLMKGKEEGNFMKAKDNYEKMQSEIALGTRFNFRDEESRRIVPKDIQPVVEKKVIDIPPENTQADLPEPIKRGRPPKRPPKKFHMPDGVPTGFIKASGLSNGDEGSIKKVLPRAKQPRTKRDISPEPIPTLEEVVLSPAEEKTFEQKYLDIQEDSSHIVEIPRNDAFPNLQRILRPTRHVTHGHVTKKAVHMLQTISTGVGSTNNRYEQTLTTQDKQAGLAQARKRALFFKPSINPPVLKQSFRDRQPSTQGCMSSRQEDFKVAQTWDLSGNSSAGEGVDIDTSDQGDDNSEDNAELASSKSSPPMLPRLAKTMYRSTEKHLDRGVDSEDDLPDVGTLVQKVGTRRVIAQEPEVRDGTSQGQRRGRRKVIQDDSDDG